ncbi:Putative zinc-finger [Haloechinothrix alba]|uniref:Putative zinc-finger n=1 Tax=Haloechinothrix alba TaxID=664784 RepID=A0A238VY46_9PSEU|nr:Putative zinc-finger [Haloechinothrix alba]
MSELGGTTGKGRQWRMRLPVSTARLSSGWQLPESHLLPDAVVAFVDGELTIGAHERAAAHIAQCASCAGEVAAQRQARSAVHDAGAPSAPDGLLASLRSIPEHAELPSGPDNIAVSEDGQVVAVQRPERSSTFGSVPLGSSAPLGSGRSRLRSARVNPPRSTGGQR